MRLPIVLRPRALAWSMKDVPWWGHLAAVAAAAGVIALLVFVPEMVYVLAAFAILFLVGVRVVDYRMHR